MGTFPRQIKFIVGNEACERFSYYGMFSILELYLSNVMRMGGDKGTQVLHLFGTAVYFLPLLGGWLADRFLGRYWTILSLSVFYCLGHGALALFEGNLSGIYLGYVLYQRNKAVIAQWQEVPAMMAVRNFFFSGWKFDQLYHALFVKPFLFITRVNKMDVFDKLYNGIAKAGLVLNQLLGPWRNYFEQKLSHGAGDELRLGLNQNRGRRRQYREERQKR